MEPAPIVCFECGQPVGDPPELHTLPDGRNCRRCADRVLAAQPGIFHQPWDAPADTGARVIEGPWGREADDAGADPEPPARA
jgi:DNA-directed RNA polymerase subunit RPC12/RpoP